MEEFLYLERCFLVWCGERHTHSGEQEPIPFMGLPLFGPCMEECYDILPAKSSYELERVTRVGSLHTD